MQIIMAEVYGPCPYHYEDARNVDIKVRGVAYHTCSGSKRMLAKILSCDHCPHKTDSRKLAINDFEEALSSSAGS